MMIKIVYIISYIVLVSIIAILLYRNKVYRNRITGYARGAILNAEELERYGREVALNHDISLKTHSCQRILPKMEDNYKYIIKTYRELNGDITASESVIPAAEWLFDNFYIIEEQVKEIRVNFPKGYNAVLPCLMNGLLKGYPRIYDIALELVSHTDGRIDEKVLINYIKAYQSKSQLTSGELWAIPIMLRIALIENIKYICEDILKSQGDRKEADRLSDIILSSGENHCNLILDIKTFTRDMDTLSPTFAEQLLKRMRRNGVELGPVMHYIAERLAAQDTTPQDIIQFEHQDQAGKQVSIGNSITSLRLVSTLDWNDIFESLSPVEQILRTDPGEIYSDMDFTSRDYYRHVVEDIARYLEISEAQVARKAVECAEKLSETEDKRVKHVGYYLIGKGRESLEALLGYKPSPGKRIIRFMKKHPSSVYLLPVLLVTAILTWFFVCYATNKMESGNTILYILSTTAIILPASELSLGIINWIITHVFQATFLPKLELKTGIPEDYASMVVIPALIPSKSRVSVLLEELEVYYLGNQENNLYFSLLGDYTDAKDKDMPEDEEIIKCALDGVRRLNKKYSSEGKILFYFFHRVRRFNEAQGVWMGWERKRGKLMEFNKLLRGSLDTTYTIKSSDNLPEIKYIITLDADTELPRNTAKRLIGTIAHPLNRAMMDETKTKVIEGYGILQPRISIGVTNANRSIFSRVFAGQSGIDPYTTAVSDIYQDLFGEGIYTGKGIFDIDVFMKALEGYIPENAVLSHDLLEGSYTRTGLVTDIEFVDSFPSKYSSYTARMHRWVRGDWQLIPWLGLKIRTDTGSFIKNPLSIISRWKIFDNLRRSLIPPSLIVLIFLTFTVLPGKIAVWLSIMFLTIAFPIFADMADAVFTRSRNRNSSFGVLSGIENIVYQISLMFVFLPYRAYLMADAIVRTVTRLTFTKKRLLEWETAADAEVRLKNDVKSYFKSMWVSQVISALLIILSLKFSWGAVAAAVMFSILWSVSPFVAFWVSKTDDIVKGELSQKDMFDLRLLSRKTWRYFEEFAGSEENYLPPDNFQEDPANGVAHRTSPTNIGLYLISSLAARDMGYMNTSWMIERLEHIFDSMDKLDTWKGHFYNWYDTKTLQPLRPLYVSTVDSGNLVGYLMTIKRGIMEYLNKPIIDAKLVSGLIDTIELLNLELVSDGKEGVDIGFLKEYLPCTNFDPVIWSTLLCELKSRGEELNKDGHLDGTLYYNKIDSMIDRFKNELMETMGWIELLQKIPESLKNETVSLQDLSKKVSELIGKLKSDISPPGLCIIYREGMGDINNIIALVPEEHEEIFIWLKMLKSAVMNGYLHVNKLSSRAKILIKKSQSIISNTEFKPLFDDKRQLFSIGYSAEDEQLNRSYYDLLASEARQTSFIAIAKGDVDQKHWFRLGRSLTYSDKYRGLVSWSGTMFEYLMPLLIMKNYKNTLFDNTYQFVLKSQIAYSGIRNVPWGVSESGYYAFDINLNYQYRAFGVPRLGLKRGLVNDMVVAPYASILALMVDPVSAIKNIEVLKEQGLEGPYGLYEAIDYTPDRMPAGKKSIIIKSFMVHHHGMSLVALDNFINYNIMQQRFHSDPYVRATELLLQERVPNRILLTKDVEEEITPLEKIEHYVEEYVKEIKSSPADFPEAHIISNGTYTTVLTNTGAGYSKSQDTEITRWREDTTLQGFGMFFYIQNVNSNNVWSATYEPYKVMPEEYRVTFSSDKVEYFRVDGNIDTHTEIVISPEDNAEIRRLSITNHSDHLRVLEVTSYFEAVISSRASDIAHPAFNNLFIKTKFIRESNTLIANRRLRSLDQKPVWLLHTVTVEGEAIGSTQYETDRSRFIGRGRNLANPEAMDIDHPLSNTAGAVLDPVLSLRKRIRIQPGETVRVSYITGIADTREKAYVIASKYNDAAAVRRAFEMAWTRSQVESRYLNLKSRDIELYQKMVSHILYISPLRKKYEDIIRKNTRGQSGLWPYGISGDVPIILVRLSKDEELDVLYQALKAHEYWRIKGFPVDLVILNEDSGSYIQDFHNKLKNIIMSSHAADIQDRPGGVFLRQANIISEEGRNLLYSVSRFIIKGEEGSLWKQLKADEDEIELVPIKKYDNIFHIYPFDERGKENLLFFNGLGGFSPDGCEYVIRLGKGQNTPAPWTNVICNENFGFIVTESGSGYTWAENSRENKLTPWSNDPVVDPQGESVYLRDEDDGRIWTVTPLPIREMEPYTVKHGFGYTVFEHISHGIEQEMTVFVPEDEKIKIVKLRLKNVSDRGRKLSACYYIRPVLGVSDQITSPFIITEAHSDSGVLLIRNTYTDDFLERVAFIDCSIEKRSVTGDRNEFFGQSGSTDSPLALKREALSGRLGGGYDPCASLMVNIQIKQNEEKILTFTLGEELGSEAAVAMALKFRNLHEVDKALLMVKGYWHRKLCAIQVKTPDASLNIMMNGWLLYQTICCRLLGRTAFYQSGGAYGFRDQLQDVLAAVYVSPEFTKKQILVNSTHQFLEGDVQHWWHPVTDRGVRTRFSDDLLWLPYVTADYIEITKDISILDSVTPYLEDEPLKELEDERYNQPKVSTISGSIYEHCVKAIDRSLKFGAHGIPLMGSGDWNDGMNRVGNKGRGESIWLGWFLYNILMKFAPLCRLKGDDERADEYLRTGRDIVSSIEKNGWDGSWYRRAYFDDGTPLGSASNAECQIDSLAQSWSIISGGGRPKRTVEAMGALEQYLIRKNLGIVMLLTPPFDKSPLDPGYIKGYVPGVRENGGQYTHAAIWVIMAFAMLGRGDKSWELYNMINPINHTSTAIEYSRYRVEPYVMAADVYAVEPYAGRGGWTWYTGAAGWMYRVCMENMLGLKIRGDSLVITPCIPGGWKEFTIKYRFKNSLYDINIKNPSCVNEGVVRVQMDGRILLDNTVPLADDKREHYIIVEMG